MQEQKKAEFKRNALQEVRHLSCLPLGKLIQMLRTSTSPPMLLKASVHLIPLIKPRPAVILWSVSQRVAVKYKIRMRSGKHHWQCPALIVQLCCVLQTVLNCPCSTNVTISKPLWAWSDPGNSSPGFSRCFRCSTRRIDCPSPPSEKGALMHVTFASRQNSMDGAVLVSVSSAFPSEVMCEIE